MKKPDKKLAFALSKPRDDKRKFIEYDNAEVSITTEEESGIFKDRTSSVKTESSKGTESILIKCTNIGQDDITYEKYRVVFYLKGEVVECEGAVDTETIKPGGSLTLQAYYYSDINDKKIQFDSYEVLLIEAFQD